MKITYNLNSALRHKDIDKMLMRLSEKDITNFYYKEVQNFLKRFGYGDNSFLELLWVNIFSEVKDRKTSYVITFYDDGFDNMNISFTLFEYLGDTVYDGIKERLSSAWQMFLIKSLGAEYKILLANRNKSILDAERRAIEAESRKLDKRKCRLDLCYKELYKRFGDVVGDTGTSNNSVK